MSTPSESFTVDDASSGERLDKFLAHARPGTTPSQIDGWIATGAIRIRGKVPKKLRRLHRGEVVELSQPVPARFDLGGKVAPLPLLHQSSAVVVINKPSGLAVEPAGPVAPSVVGGLARQLSGWSVEGQARPGVVHRLDKETSGCLMLARSDAAVASLKAAFDAGTIEKTYLVCVLGQAKDQARLDQPYGRDPKDPRRYTTRVRSARRAVLSYKTLRVREGCSVLEVKLETGRTHQIRVQLGEAGLPVLGDPFYGPMAARTHPAGPGRQALHALRLGFPDPSSGRRIDVEAPIPDDLAETLRRLHP
jgi:23S rRNA pseudouridine1911/1915/1917 synthase